MCTVAHILWRLHCSPGTDQHARSQIHQFRKLLELVSTRLPAEEAQGRRFRPLSPVKALSNFLGAYSKDAFLPARQAVTTFHTSELPSTRPSGHLLSSNSHQSLSGDPLQCKIASISTSELNPKDSIRHLEETLNAYIIALRSRSGNVVGKILRARATADELRVNELCNTLVEDPSQVQAAAEVSVDILFASFEKFLHRAWMNKIGPVLTSSILIKMQTILDSSSGIQAVEGFKATLSEMSPQNHRAFGTIIKLLADLLEASGNDGDRGALIASFAEALVVDGVAHDFINSLDRLADDYEILFEDSSTVHTGSNSKQSRSFNNGSMSSNTSSFRKRFGLASLTRENSKSESESKVGYVWRTLSKKSSESESQSQPPSLSKSFLSRSLSTDTDSRKFAHSRPTSRDRPDSTNSSQDGNSSRPGSAHNTVSSLVTIGESGAETFTPRSRKKRRSSLSDLAVLNGANIPAFSPRHSVHVGLPGASTAAVEVDRGSLRTPSPSKQVKHGSEQPSPSQPFPSPSKKENLSSPTKIFLGERSINRKSDEVVVSSFSPKKISGGHSRIPSVRSGPLQNRPSPTGNISLSPKKATVSPQKLRIQSPQKVRR